MCLLLYGWIWNNLKLLDYNGRPHVFCKIKVTHSTLPLSTLWASSAACSASFFCFSSSRFFFSSSASRFFLAFSSALCFARSLFFSWAASALWKKFLEHGYNSSSTNYNFYIGTCHLLLCGLIIGKVKTDDAKPANTISHLKNMSLRLKGIYSSYYLIVYFSKLACALYNYP